jgi:SWI/SNF-related matrix-associated actin-dependent regulator of chromatin subfamily A-like protein 1
MTGKIELWPHQRSAAARRNSYLMAHEPGCGKTLTAAVMGKRFSHPHLYICPATLRHQIAKEIRRVRPTATIQVIESGKDMIRADVNVLICSYDMACGHAIFKQLIKRQWGLLSLDEAHALKNMGSKRTRMIYGARHNSPGALYRRAEITVPMTGTPILNNPADLYPHYSRLFPNAIHTEHGRPLTHTEFVEEFCQTKRTGFGIKIVGGKNLDRLRKHFQPSIDRVRLVDVAQDLPACTVDNIALEADGTLFDKDLTPELTALIKRLCGRDDFDPKELEALMMEPMIATMRRRVGLIKAKPVADLIELELDGGVGKIAVFGLHPEVLERISARLNAYEPVTITGQTKNREDARMCFINEPTCRVFLGQSVAAGQGLDGFQHVCSRVLVAEPAWTPAMNAQVIARVLRAGQLKPVHASFVGLRGSVDDDVARALSRKTKIAHEALDAEATV